MGADRTRLPGLGPEPTYTFPEIRRRTLHNGLRVSTVEHHEVPLISVLALVPSGAAADPPDRPGLAAITGDLLDEGSGDLDALEFHDALARIGAHIETEVGADATLLEITVLERFASRALELLASVLMDPRLEPQEFERVRELRLNRLLQLREVPPAIAERTFARLMYGEHPYGHLPIGSEQSLRAMDVEDVHRFHRAAYTPGRLSVIAVGDRPHERLAELVEQAFGQWTSASPVGPPDCDAALAPVRTKKRVALIDRPGAPQSELRIGHASPPRSSPDYHALLVLNLILGGQFVSRINMKLREQKGYTYGARTTFDFRRGPGPFVLQASVQSDATADAVRESLAELRAIGGDRPVARHELELGRAGLTRGYPRNFETADQVGRAAAQLDLYELSDDYFTTFVPRILALRETDITNAARRHIDPSSMVTVVVGDRDKAGDLAAATGSAEPVEHPGDP